MRLPFLSHSNQSDNDPMSKVNVKAKAVPPANVDAAQYFHTGRFDSTYYADHPPHYPEKLFKVILDYHDASNDAGRRIAVDAGAGTGIVANALAKQFDQVYAIEPAANQLRAAKRNVTTRSGKDVIYWQGSAEMMPCLNTNSVDLIVSATAAHWFEKTWWFEASRVLRRGGTVALFTVGPMFLAPTEPVDPVYEHLRPILDRLRSTLKHFAHPNESHIDTLYTYLPLPDPEMPFVRKSIRHLWWNTLYSLDVWDIAPNVLNAAIPSCDSELDMLRQGTTEELLDTIRIQGPYIRYLNNRERMQSKEPELLSAAYREIQALPGWNKNLVLRWNHPLALVLVKKKL